MNNNKVMASDEVIMNKILVIRGKKVMIDMGLAELYGVETKRLNEQVKRNLKRFPEDFMFQVNQEEKRTANHRISSFEKFEIFFKTTVCFYRIWRSNDGKRTQ